MQIVIAMFSARMDILTLALPPSLRSKLIASGFHTTAALASLTPFQLAREAQITFDEALAVLSLVPRTCSDHIGGPLAGSTTAWDLLMKEKGRRIGTGSYEVDKILGGGILSKQLTEICGVPGVGKTQLSMQLAVNVQIPVKFGGVGGHAIYIEALSESEKKFPEDDVLPLGKHRTFWRLSLPFGANRDHPFCNPLSADAPQLAGVKFPRMLLIVGGKDPLHSRQIEYYNVLKQAGKQVELVEVPEGTHVFRKIAALEAENVRVDKATSDFIHKSNLS